MKQKKYYYMACDITNSVWYYYIAYNKKAIQKDLERRGITNYTIYDPFAKNNVEYGQYIDLTKLPKVRRRQ